MTHPLPELDETSTFPTPINEEARLSALHWLKILDTPQDERFDRIVRLAAAHFGTPMARITFVDRTRTWYKSCVGPAASESPRNVALCAHTIMADDILVSCDLSKDPRFCDSPQVIGGPKLRFYAASPITLDDGMRVGSLCLIDVVPRSDFSQEDRVFLADLAQIVVHELELHRLGVGRENDLDDTKRRLAIARSAKERFMNMVSHELKTPLLHIVGFADILASQRMGPLGNEAYVDFARSLCTSAEHLDGLVNRVLHFASAETGELRLSETAVTTDTIVKKCLKLVRLRGATANVNVRLLIDEDAPARIFVDEIQYVEAVVQILNNAIEFSSHDEMVVVHCRAAQDGGLCIGVLDRGTGFEPDRIEHLLGPFTQGEEGFSRSHDGMGLGLTVSRAIMELHGGKLVLANRPNGGACVELTLPASRNRTAEQQAEALKHSL